MSDEVMELYKALGITETEYPEYKSANEFSKTLKKYTVTRSIPTTTTNGTREAVPLFTANAQLKRIQ